MATDFNFKFKQVFIAGLLLFIVVLLFKSLSAFLPGILGGFTLYIITRENYFQLIYKKKLNKSLAAALYVLYYLVLLGIPIYLAVALLTPKIDSLINNPAAIMDTLKLISNKIQNQLNITLLSTQNIQKIGSKITEILPSFLNSTANLVTNLAIMLFITYHMLLNGVAIEKLVVNYLPFKPQNINLLASEGKKVIKANALGLPIIAIIQGVTATIGYVIFGVNDWGLWGFLTGVFAFFPVVGTMIIWIPLVLYMYATGDNVMATGLLIYSIVVTGNVDYLARITIMKKMGDVHPVITILGVIAGFELFGFIGLIFGPLLINYAFVLFRIYMNEFIDEDKASKELTEVEKT